MRVVLVLVFFFAIETAVWAQGGDKWEISGVGGGSFYRDVLARGSNPSRSAKAGFFDGAAAGAVLSQTGRQHWGGEFYYLFQTNNMRLLAAEGSSGRADFAAQSHSFHYDAVLYFTPRNASIRPFISGGPGFKVYESTGQERAFRPLSDIVIFSRQSQTKFLVSAGGGVKFRVFRNGMVRLDLRDYVTGVPKSFTAFPGVRLGGQFHNFVATGGLGITF